MFEIFSQEVLIELHDLNIILYRVQIFEILIFLNESNFVEHLNTTCTWKEYQECYKPNEGEI